MLTKLEIERLVFEKPTLPGAPRFTQDSPILPDVWFEYARPFLAETEPGSRQDHPVDLLLNPYRGSGAAPLYARLDAELQTRRPTLARSDARESADLSYNESFVVVRLWFDELIRVALPLTRWWKRYAWGSEGLADVEDEVLVRLIEGERGSRAASPFSSKKGKRGQAPVVRGDLLWLIRLAGRLAWEREIAAGNVDLSSDPLLGSIQAFRQLVEGVGDTSGEAPLLWSVGRTGRYQNRTRIAATGPTTIPRSRRCG